MIYVDGIGRSQTFAFQSVPPLIPRGGTLATAGKAEGFPGGRRGMSVAGGRCLRQIAYAGAALAATRTPTPRAAQDIRVVARRSYVNSV